MCSVLSREALPTIVFVCTKCVACKPGSSGKTAAQTTGLFLRKTLKAIADAWLRNTQSRCLWIRFDLLAQVAHVHAQCLDIGALVVRPGRLQQLAMRQHLAGVQDELMQQARIRAA